MRWEIGCCMSKGLTKSESLPLSLEAIENEGKLGKQKSLFVSWTLALTLVVSSMGLAS